MRYLPVMAVVCLLIFTGCSSASNERDAIKQFIPGIYVKEVKNEFLIASDTFIIQRTTGDNYLIVNNTSYQRIKGNRLSARQYSTIRLHAVFNDKSENLDESRLGKTFSFDPGNKAAV